MYILILHLRLHLPQSFSHFVGRIATYSDQVGLQTERMELLAGVRDSGRLLPISIVPDSVPQYHSAGSVGSSCQLPSPFDPRSNLRVASAYAAFYG
jgi:hypothetical protein